MAVLRLRLLALLSTLLASYALADDTPEGKIYLSKNEGQKGVVVTKSGLQYKVINAGPEDGQHPRPNEKCKCHYVGTTVDGQEFDSSVRRGTPASFAPNQVILGWLEAMQLMTPGDKWELTIPSKLAYKDSQRGRFITPGSVLIFQLEILSCSFAKVHKAHSKERRSQARDKAAVAKERLEHKRKTKHAHATPTGVHAHAKHTNQKKRVERAPKSRTNSAKHNHGKAQGDVGDVGDSPAKSMRKLQKELEEMIKKGDDVTPAEMKKMRHKLQIEKKARKARARKNRAHHGKNL